MRVETVAEKEVGKGCILSAYGVYFNEKGAKIKAYIQKSGKYSIFYKKIQKF